MARTTPAHAARWPLVILIFTHAVSGQFLNVVSNVSQNIQVATEQTWEGATLSFCIDTTGSMYDDLLQVRNGVRNIFRAISEQQEIPIVNYALVTFHDPEVNLATLTADQATFENAVEASLEVHGGGDCPEMAVGGINLALRRSLPRSFIFVFTDASAKDYQLKTQALSLIQETQSQVIFVLTGDCNDQSGEGFRAFKDIAAASAGQIFFLRQKNEVAEVLKFIEISVNARQVNILSVETRPGAARYQIPVDGSLQQLIVSVSTNTTTGVNVRLPDVRVMSPNGQEFFPTVDLGSVVVINITKPAVGWWNLFVDSPLPYSVRVKGVSLLDFKIHFTVASGTQRVFITRPVEGQSSFIVLQPSDAAGHLLVTGMQLINLAGTVIHDIPLNWTTSNPYPRLAHPGFEAPQQLFYVRVQGIDSQNMTFYRLTPTPVQPGLPSPPTVIDWLTDISGELGGSVQLRCDYRSLVQASVVWYRDGVPIDTISRTDPRFLVLADGKLLITRLSLNDANCYRCQVVSIAGNDTGRPVCLEVLQPPRITQPAQGQCNTSVVPGNGFQLQCRASGDPTPTISWQKDGIKIESTSRMRVFSNGLLRVRQALPGDDGRYTCVAENGVGRPDTRDCYILLMTAPSFTSVSDVIAIVGQRAILTCLSDGSPTPQITWWDGQDRIRNTSRITSLPSGILNISRVELGDEGSYTCVASNPAGRRSSTGFLTIHVPPEIVVAPDPLYVRSVDSEFRLLCVASGKPDPVTIWLFNDRPVDQSRVRVNSNTLTVSRLSVADEGSYTCLANNDAGTANSTTVLIVQVPPAIITTQTQVIVLRGTPAFLPCEVIGKPTPTVTWQSSVYDERYMSQIPTRGLQISAARLEHRGLYTCTAANPAGSASHTIELVVEAPPSIAGPTEMDIVVFPGTYICMDCEVVGLPIPSVVWQRNLRRLPVIDEKWIIHPNDTLCVISTVVADSDIYVCLARNKHGDARKDYNLTVLEPPRPDGPPVDVVTVTANSPTVLPCPVTGNPKPEVRWFYLGTNTLVPLGGRITQSGDNSLVLESVTAEDSRGYQCVASNEVGTTTINVTLDVKVAPVIEPFAYTEVVANVSQIRVLLPCIARANPPATITWLKDFQPVTPEFLRYLISTDGTLIVTSIQANDAGFYTCEASNEVGTATLSLRVIVQVPPVITQSPQNQAIIVGSNVAFQCKATGLPSPVISWHTRGQPLDIEGEFLALDSVQPRRDRGNYTCQASNILGTVQATASLDVLVPPEIVGFGDVKVEEPVAGEGILLPCPASGNPPPTIFWMRDNEIITATSQRYRIFPNGSLWIPTLEGADRGVYVCRINSSVGVDELRYDLNVKVHPEFTSKPKNTTTRVGSTVWMHCSASGSPVATVTWLKDGQRLQVESVARLRQANNGSLQIINVLASDQGKYTCLVGNELGILTGDGHLTVQVRPNITPPVGSDQNPSTQQGDAIMLNCPSEGNPPPIIEWERDGVQLVEDPERHVMYSNGSLLLRFPKGEDSGRYTCKALNQLGEDEISFILNVNVKPVFTMCPVVAVVPQGRSTRFDCVATGRPQPVIYWTSSAGIDSRSNFNDPHFVQLQNNSLLVQALRPSHAATYTCHAVNVVGQDNCSASLTVEVPPVIDAPPSPVATIDENSPITLPCPVRGLPPPTVTWYKNGQPLVADGVRISILNNGQQLRISSAQGDDTANYECRAKNKLGEVAQSFQIAIQVAPTINLVPQDQTVQEGQTAVFHCGASGRPRPRLQWFKAVQTGDLFPVLRTAHIQLLRNGSLVIRDTQPSHAGVFVCVAANVLGEDRQSALLNVQVLPNIPELDEPRPEVDAGGILTLPCPAEGNPPPQIRWLKDGALVTFSNRIQQAPSGALVILDARPSDDGDYQCVASNPVGDVTLDVPVTIRVSPSFTQLPQNTTAEVGKPTWLHCVAGGNPAPEVSWLRNGSPLQADSHLRLYSNNTLYIPFVEINDDASYTCVTKNDLGETRHTIHLNVEREPTIAPPGAAPTAVFVGNTTTLVCEFNANPPPQVYWVYNGRILFTTGRYNVTTIGNVHTLQIAGAAQEDAGNYTCRVRNRLGETERIFVLNVNTPSDILQPEDTSVDVAVGQPLILSCVVSGFPPPEIAWLKDGSPIVPSDRLTIKSDNSLELSSLEAGDSAQYTCVATNDINADVLVYDLRVLVPPSIVVGPEDRTVSPGQSVEFFCVAEGVPKPAILWIHDDREITPDRAAREGFALRQDGTLLVPTVSHQHAGRYQCVVINSQGQDRETAVLTVFSAPEIITPPSNQEAPVSGQAVFHCVAHGLPIPNITWVRNGEAVEVQRGSVSTRGGYLILSNVQVAMAGVYTCVAMNQVSSVRANATLTVHVAPTVTGGEQDRTIKEGDNIVLHCQVEGSPDPVVSWLKGDRPLLGERFKQFPNHTLVVQNAQATDSGIYRCVAVNLVGRASFSATVNVQVPPHIDDLSEMPYVIEGDVAVLPCNAYGDPLPRVTWYNGELPMQMGGRYFMRQDNALEIQYVEQADSGMYQCRAENPAGTYRMDVSLDVKEPPKILVPSSMPAPTVAQGGDTVLQCPASGNPRPTITWLRDGQEINFKADGTAVDDANMRLHGDGSLSIASAGAKHAVTYQCVATNEVGRDTYPFQLVVQTKPRINSPDTSIILQRGQHLQLRCTVLGIPQPTVRWLHNGRPMQQTVSHARSTYKQSDALATLLVSSVVPSDAGVFACEAVNALGTARHNVTVDVYVAPEIVNPQADINMIPGTNVQFTCSAVGHPTPQITWYRNDQPVPRRLVTDSDGSLNIAAVIASDSGVYRCVANNSVDRVSHSFRAFVQETPKISTEPTVQQIIAGSTVWLHCVATGNPEPTLSWERSGVQVTSFGRDRIYDNGTLVISDVRPGDEGSYECFARNPAGHASVVHSFTVLIVPSFLPPQPITPCLSVLFGATAVFQCRVTGRPVPVVTWRKAPSSESIVSGQRLKVTKAGSLQIDDISPGDSGVYVCSATNAAGKVEQRHELCVQEPPSILLSLLDWTVVAGQMVTLRCDVTGMPHPRVAWLKDDRPLPGSDRVVQDMDATQSATLQITEALVSDGGKYTCVATNDAGSAQESGTLIVQVAPIFKIVPYDIDPVVGSSIVLPCAAKGVPAPSIQWTVGSYVLPGSNPRFSMKNGGSLAISDIVADDAGTYVCAASNSAGSVKAAAQVSVLVAPRIIQGPVDKWISAGETLTLKCRARGSPMPTQTWLHNGAVMQFVDDTLGQSVLSDGTLRIESVEAKHTGVYRCRYNNSAGAVTRRARVNVQFAPAIVDSQSEVYAQAGANIVLRCTGQGSPTPAMCWLRDGKLVISEDNVHIMDGGVLLIANARQDQTGTYTCKATNILGVENADSQVIILAPTAGQPGPMPAGTTPGSSADYPLPAYTPFQPIELRFPLPPSQQSPSVAVLMDLPCTSGVAYPNPIWMRNGSPLQAGNKYEVLGSGALRLRNPTRADRGVYECTDMGDDGSIVPINDVFVVFTGEGGEPISSDSDEYPLIPRTPPTPPPTSPAPIITSEFTVTLPVSINITSVSCGHQLNLFCGERSQNAAVWTKDGLPVVPGNDLELTVSGGLIIPESQVGDAGVYFCYRNGDVVQAYQVNVEVSGHMTVYPVLPSGATTVFILLEASVLMTCRVVTCAQYTVQWFKNGQPIQTLAGKFEMFPNGSMLLTNMERSDRGRYYCRATSATNYTENEMVQLRFYVPPTIDTHPLPRRLVVDANTAFHCTTASGRPRPTISWTKNGAPFDVSATPRYEQLLNGSLVIRGVQVEDAGVYRCMAMSGPLIAESKPGTLCVNAPLSVLDNAIEFGTRCIFDIDGEFSDWTPYTTCPVTCGGGQRTRSRQCNNPAPQGTGHACRGPARETARCGESTCPIDGGWTDYSIQVQCGQACSDDNTYQIEVRYCNNPPPQHGGLTCPGSPTRQTQCVLPRCNVAGSWSDWESWSDCECGSSTTRQRTRTCTNPPPLGNGADCVGSPTQTEDCVLAPCPSGSQWRSGRGDFTATLGSTAQDTIIRPDIALDFVSGNQIRLAIPGLTAAQNEKLRFFQAQLLMPLVFLRSRVEATAMNGASMHQGYAKHVMFARFDTGQAATINTTITTSQNGFVRLSISIDGQAPEGLAPFPIRGFSGNEQHARYSPSEWVFLSERARYQLTSRYIGVQWSQRMECQRADGSPATCQQLTNRQQVFGVTRQMTSSFNPSTGLFLATTPMNSRIFPVPGAVCPSGLETSSDGRYCIDGDNCRERRCPSSTSCVDVLGFSYCV